MTGLPPALPAPYAGLPQPEGPKATPELGRLVDAQVEALVSAAPATAGMPAEDRDALAQRIARVATYVAALALDDWRLSDALGQRPLIKTRETMRPANDDAAVEPQRAKQPLARAQADFQGDATSRVGSVTRSTLRAISFPSFVADLIKGTFNAILDATQTQMGAFTEMLDAVSKTVDQFENENISNAQAEQWLAQSYPGHIRLEAGPDGPRAVPTDAEEPPAGIRAALNLSDDVDAIDEVTLEETLIPAARRKLAQSRLQMLSTMVMMGLQRIVINHGRIRATMGFHIDATDTASEERADLLDTHVGVQGQVGFGWWSASASTSVTYVRSTKADSNAELNVNADLTGEVDLTFSTDYMPLNRMATTERIARIRANTPNPEENAPSAAATGGASEAAQSPSASQMIANRMQNRNNPELPELPDLQPGSQPSTRRQGRGNGERAQEGDRAQERDRPQGENAQNQGNSGASAGGDAAQSARAGQAAEGANAQAGQGAAP